MDLIRLAARIVLNTTEYSAGLKKAEAEAERSSQKIAKETDAIASSTERANAKMESSTQSVVSARQDLLDNIAEIKKMFKEEVALFDEGAISADEYTEDIKNLKSMYKDATKQLREFDSVMDEGTRSTDRQATSMKGLRGSTMLAVSAISMLAGATIKAIQESLNAAHEANVSGAYYDVNSEDYLKLREAFRSSGADPNLASTLLESSFEISKNLKEGDVDTYLAFSRAGIDASAFLNAGDDTQKVLFLLNQLQGIDDVSLRRQASMDIFGDSTGRSIQYALNGGSILDYYNNAYVPTNKDIEKLDKANLFWSDFGHELQMGWNNLITTTPRDFFINPFEKIAQEIKSFYDGTYLRELNQRDLSSAVNGIGDVTKDRPIEVNVNLNGEEIAKAVEKQSVINGSNASGGGRKS